MLPNLIEWNKIDEDGIEEEASIIVFSIFYNDEKMVHSTQSPNKRHKNLNGKIQMYAQIYNGKVRIKRN